MLDFGFSEVLLTSAIALVVLGPERLPKVARQVGNWMGRARLMARQLSEQLEREVNAEELLKQQRDLKKHLDLQLDKPVLPPADSDAAGNPPLPSETPRPLHPTSVAAMHPTSAAAMHPTSAAAMHPTSAAAMHPTPAAATAATAYPEAPTPVEPTQAP
jgi:sec-independent protein translocase protein TatB